MRTLIVTAGTAVALSAALLTGCSSSPSESGTETAASQQATSVAVVDPAAFQQAIDNGAEVIDVRTPAEYAAGHIEGAANIDIASPDFATQIAALDRTKSYAVYCQSGNRSGVATTQMVDIGFTSVTDLDGGILAWKSAGYPVA